MNQFKRVNANHEIEGSRSSSASEQVHKDGPLQAQQAVPLISIVTVVFNGAKTLEQTIQGVLNQTYKNIEYIIIDGGSTDGTLDIIKKYDDRIALWVSEPDKGLYDAMNKGISKANGDIIGMINSDDWYEPNAVETVVEAYRQNPGKKIFHGDLYNIREEEPKQPRRFNPSKLKFLYYAMTYNHPSMFVHKSVYEEFAYNIKLKSLSDYEFVLRSYLRWKDAFHYIPKAYVNFRVAGISSQMMLPELIREGHLARKNAGMGLFSLIISATVRTLVFVAKRRRVEVKK